MSYDIFAFDPDTAPGDANMLAWYEKQAEWSESHSYQDPAVTTPKLRAFYREIIKVFPPMSGPDCPDDDEEADTDYTIGRNILYGAFRWSKYHHAREVFLQLGQVHGVGVCEVSEAGPPSHRPDALGAS
jgi:hypothetical protein